MRITSRQNPLVTRFRDAARGDSTRILLDGEHLLRDALAAGVILDVAAFSDEAASGRLAALAADAREAGATVAVVAPQVLDAMSPVRQPSGVVALAERPAWTLKDVFSRAPQLVVLLADVQDPGNVGAIIRAAEGCGASGVVALDGTADPFGWKALRGAMGSSLRLPVVARESLPSALAQARERRLRVYATAPRDGTPLPSSDLRIACAIMLGGEGGGLSGEVMNAADARLTIPMRGGIESLNVAAAAAIVLYEAARQRMEPNHVPVR